MVEQSQEYPRHRRRSRRNHGTLTSARPLKRGQAPASGEVQHAVNCLLRAAARMERCEEYAQKIAKDCLTHGHRLDLMRLSLVLVFKNASVGTVWDAIELFLVPALAGVCDGRRSTHNFIGTGMIGSDGREYLSELGRVEGEPLQRVVDAIARHCPQTLYGHPESDND